MNYILFQDEATIHIFGHVGLHPNVFNGDVKILMTSKWLWNIIVTLQKKTYDVLCDETVFLLYFLCWKTLWTNLLSTLKWQKLCALLQTENKIRFFDNPPCKLMLFESIWTRYFLKVEI